VNVELQYVLPWLLSKLTNSHNTSLSSVHAWPEMAQTVNISIGGILRYRSQILYQTDGFIYWCNWLYTVIHRKISHDIVYHFLTVCHSVLLHSTSEYIIAATRAPYTSKQMYSHMIGQWLHIQVATWPPQVMHEVSVLNRNIDLVAMASRPLGHVGPWPDLWIW